MTTTITGSGITFNTGQSLNDPGNNIPMYAARNWVRFNGTGSIGANQTVTAGGNISSVTKQNGGEFTVNFSVAMNDLGYCALACNNGAPASAGGGIGGNNVAQGASLYGITTGYVLHNCTFPNVGRRDPAIACMTLIR